MAIPFLNSTEQAYENKNVSVLTTFPKDFVAHTQASDVGLVF